MSNSNLQNSIVFYNLKLPKGYKKIIRHFSIKIKYKIRLKCTKRK